MSEASVKRIFAAHISTLERLDQICAVLEIAISDLARKVSYESDTPSRLSWEQEKLLVSDPKLLLVAVHVLNHWAYEEIVEAYAIAKSECIRLLERVDKLGIINLMPNYKIRACVARNFTWLPNGPIQQRFRALVTSNFLRSYFDQGGELMVSGSGMLSRTNNAVCKIDYVG